MSSLLSRRLITAFGVLAVVAGLLAFTVASPSITIGQETDPISDPAADVAQPPASLPDTGTGVGESNSYGVRLMVMLGALGVTLAGASYVAARQTRRIEDS